MGDLATANESLGLPAGSRHAPLPVEKFLDAVLRDLVDADLDDDIAVMAVRFTPTG